MRPAITEGMIELVDRPRPADVATLNRAVYDRIASRYHANQIAQGWAASNAFSELQASFAERLPKAALVADLGCGPGSDAAALSRRAFRVVGVDLSAGMLRVAAASIATVVQGDLRALPLLSGAFDGVWSSAALLHVPNEETMVVLDEVRRILRPGGLFALATSTGVGSGFEQVPYAPEEQRWYAYRSTDQTCGELERAGFALESVDHVEGTRPWVRVLAVATLRR